MGKTGKRKRRTNDYYEAGHLRKRNIQKNNVSANRNITHGISESNVKEDEGFSDDNLIINVEDDVPPDKVMSTNVPYMEHMKDLKREPSTKPISGLQCSTHHVKPETFESGYGVRDAMLNGYTDLFHEVDSLMNIKHEDHLNDTVFYLPMSCPGEINPHVELENAIQVSEALRNDFPSSVFYSQDMKSEPGIVDSLPFSDFLNEHSKEFQSCSGINSSFTHSPKKQQCNSVNKRRKSADSRLGDNHKSAASIDYLGLVDNILPASRKSRIKSGKSDSQSDDSGIGDTHSMETHSDGTGSPALSESDGITSSVDVCSFDSSTENSPEANDGEWDVKDKTEEQDNNSKSIKCERNSEKECETDENEKIGEEEVKVEVEDDSYEQVEENMDNMESCCSSGSKEEPSDIDRFVICSDHTMECVLCSYTTESYSAFKSHIICSHPCWRITKKLSKNRLLVERSIKNGIRIPSKKIGEKALPGDLNSTLTGGRKLNKKYIYRRQLFERNKRLFKCVLCLRLFVFEGSVVNHVTETHQEKIPYDFIHVSNDHGEQFGPIYRCSQKSCFYSADNEGDLSKHHTERHTQVIYRCQLCGFTAEAPDSVRAHGLKMHKQQLACFIATGPIAVTQATSVKS